MGADHGNVSEWRGLQEAISKAGFRLFISEHNLYCKTDHNCVEFAYVHEACLGRLGLAASFTLNFPP